MPDVPNLLVTFFGQKLPDRKLATSRDIVMIRTMYEAKDEMSFDEQLLCNHNKVINLTACVMMFVTEQKGPNTIMEERYQEVFCSIRSIVPDTKIFETTSITRKTRDAVKNKTNAKLVVRWMVP
jgi:hypothetical protein